MTNAGNVDNADNYPDTQGKLPKGALSRIVRYIATQFEQNLSRKKRFEQMALCSDLP